MFVHKKVIGSVTVCREVKILVRRSQCASLISMAEVSLPRSIQNGALGRKINSQSPERFDRAGPLHTGSRELHQCHALLKPPVKTNPEHAFVKTTLNLCSALYSGQEENARVENIHSLHRESKNINDK